VSGEDIITQSQKYGRRLGVGVQANTGKGHAFVNGRYFTISDVSDTPTTIQSVSVKLGLAEHIPTNG
jgi:hypothetical protein